MARRSEMLKAIAEDFTRVHNTWAEDNNRPAPDETYWDSVEELQNTFSQGDIPADCRELGDAVKDFLDEFATFDNRQNPNDVMPRDSFWAARQKIEQVLRGPTVAELKPLETIKQLAELPNMSHRQIAQMWGFLDRRGQPMPHLVQRELDSPGCVINAKKGSNLIDGRDWIDPRLLEQHQQAEAVEQGFERIKSKRAKAGDVADKPCPESPLDLWEQDVPVKQAARMLLMDEGDVAKLFSGYEIERQLQRDVRDGKAPQPAATTVPPADNPPPPAPPAKTPTTADQVLTLFKAGKKPSEIAKELKIEPKQVEAVLKGAV